MLRMSVNTITRFKERSLIANPLKKLSKRSPKMKVKQDCLIMRPKLGIILFTGNV